MLLDYGQGEKEIKVSVKTLVIYEQEFGSDLIQDLFGRVVVRRDEKQDDDVLDVIDYRNVNWTAATKALWASLKTADSSIPHYDEWSETLADINLFSLCGEFFTEIRRRLFRFGDNTSD